MSTPLRSMVALLVLGCATTTPVSLTYEATQEASLSCGQSTNGREYGTLQPCYDSVSVLLAREPALIPVLEQARLECARRGIEPMTPQMDVCMTQRRIQLEAAAGPSSAQIAGQVFLDLLSIAGRAAGAASAAMQPTYTSYPEAPTMRPPITCYTIEDGWGGSRTMCQ